jgi:hypothetical protein
MTTADDNHAAEMRSALLHRRANRTQEKEMLLKAPARIKEIDAELILINADLERYTPPPEKEQPT